jgi:hypothetical protein
MKKTSRSSPIRTSSTLSRSFVPKISCIANMINLGFRNASRILDRFRAEAHALALGILSFS